MSIEKKINKNSELDIINFLSIFGTGLKCTAYKGDHIYKDCILVGLRRWHKRPRFPFVIESNSYVKIVSEIKLTENYKEQFKLFANLSDEQKNNSYKRIL